MFRKCTGIAAAGMVAACFAFHAPASAQDFNSASAVQIGTGNSLYTDQSNASGSTIGTKANPFGSLGLSSGPLSQIGTGNMATITVTGTPAPSGLNPALGNAFLQQGSDGTPSTGNSATINILGLDSVGSVTQNGNHNNATLTASNGAQGGILQQGDHNNAGLNVSGLGTNILYQQIGSNLVGALTITSTSGYPGVPVSATAAPITITQSHN